MPSRLVPSELHIGERLTMLVQLISERVRCLYAPDLLDRIAGQRNMVAAPVPAIAVGDYVIVAAKKWIDGPYLHL